jgi:hypothetical protein
MNGKYGSGLAFLDLLFNTLLCFVALFAISFLLINPVAEQKKVDVKAEFLITVSWPEEVSDDVDIYVRDPVGNLVYFKNRESGLMHLDRDDLGHKNDIISGPAGVVEYKENQEVVTIRGIYSGEYIVNIHMYNKISEGAVQITVEVEKLNPYVKILSKTISMTHAGEERTVCRMIIDSEKNVESINYLSKSLIGGGQDYSDPFEDYMNNNDNLLDDLMMWDEEYGY